MGLCPTQYLPIAGDVAAYRALDLGRTAEIVVHFIIKSRHTSVKEECRPNDWERFVVHDMSKTETCQSRRAATNEKKGGILSRLIRQNAFNSRSVGRDDVDQWIKRWPYFPPNKTKAFNALFFRTVGRDDVDKWIKRCSLDAAWTVRILRDQKHCVDASGMSDLHRTVVIFIASCSTSDGADKSWKSSTIAVRSSHDRAAIAARSNRDLTSFIAESFQPDPTAADRDPGPRSWPDRGSF